MLNAFQMTSSDDQPPLILVIMPSSGSSSVRYAKRADVADDILEEIFEVEELTFDTETSDADASETAVSFANSSRPADADPLCFPSNRTCDYSSSSCSGHGACVLVSNSTKESRTGECWACKCVSGYLGAQCQKGDYVL